MRHILLFLFLATGLWAESQQPSISGGCKSTGSYPQCDGGEVVFTGSNFPAQVHVKVTNSAGDVIDYGDYSTNNGVLRFVENLSFADTYTIAVNGQTLLTVTTG